ncbi:MAG: zinc ribbon domain-containing protein [Clostridia bacterium]|nr:zinc ribbon domain-containing protein [Clostridia bacterium]
MYCQKCGSENAEGSAFCSKCGEPMTGDVSQANVSSAPSEGRVTLYPDGKYRWRYEMSLFKNPTYFWLVWKIFFFIILGIFAFITIIDAFDWGIEHAAENLPMLLYFLIGMTVITIIGYLIYAAIMGGKYIVDFEMDENGINHAQAAKQAKKAKAIGTATMVAGLATGRLTTVGVGLNAQRTEMYSDFNRVKKVKAYPRKNTIKVNETLNHNQVYASDEDFEFVKNFIVSHCPNLKNK